MILLGFLPRRLRIATFLAAACALLVYFTLWLTVRSHAYHALENPPAHHADAALILGTRAYLNGAPNPCLVGRVTAGVDLANQGLVSTLMMSGGKDKEDGRIEAVTMQEISRDNGFKGSIILEEKSRSTKENFNFSRPLLKAAGIQHIIVVTEPYHLWRAQKLIEAGQLGDGFDVQYKASPSQCWNTWGMAHRGSLREPLAIIYNYAKGYLTKENTK